MKLGIITLAELSGQFYKEQIQFLFDNRVDVQNYSFEKKNINSIKKYNKVLVSTSYQHELIRDYLSPNTTVVIGKVTLSKKGFDILKTFEQPLQAMFVNQNLEMCLESISTIYSIGFKNFQFIPVYPGISVITDLDIAFTNGEDGLVPSSVESIIDLGHRILDKNTVVELAYALSLEECLNSKKMKHYFRNTVSTDTSIELLLSKSYYLEKQIGNLLQIMDKGVIMINKSGLITNINKFISDKFNLEEHEIIGKRYETILPDVDFSEIFGGQSSYCSTLIRMKKSIFSCSVYSNIEQEYNTEGAIVIVEDFRKTEKKQNTLRLQLLNKGHIAKYTVEDIIYTSDKMGKIVQIIKRIAKSDSSVLITGESGSGKELIAQSIHNLSSRKESHFVAINCAALPESLLESELFGYMPGAFTGALSNGKIGIFEMANNGTLFLDEIGELPINLQLRLLRVLQEREIMRLGGDEVIKIDIRLITATNTDLLDKIKHNAFRKDLFYRLNVLPIRVPPLRERKEDIRVLIKYFQDNFSKSLEISEEAYQIMELYDWDGNVRELENCVEYLINLNKRFIKPEDLPYYITDYPDVLYGENITDVQQTTEPIGELLQKHEKYLTILGILAGAFYNKQRMGRRSILDMAFQRNIFIGEYEIRKMLQVLNSYRLVTSGVGREGTIITNNGICYYNMFNGSTQ